MMIRKLSIEDYDEIYDLWMATPGMGLNDIDDSRTGIEKYLRRNPDSCFAAEERGKIAGVILSGHDGRRGLIHHMAVLPEYRNIGIGSALVDAAIEALKNEGITKAALLVYKKNEIGNAFWERKGFLVREDLNYRDIVLTEIVQFK